MCGKCISPREEFIESRLAGDHQSARVESFSNHLVARPGIHDGVLLGRVAPGGPAERAGLRSGDIITYLNSERVHHSAEVRQAVRRLKPGSRVSLTVMRDGRAFTTAIHLDRSGAE